MLTYPIPYLFISAIFIALCLYFGLKVVQNLKFILHFTLEVLYVLHKIESRLKTYSESASKLCHTDNERKRKGLDGN